MRSENPMHFVNLLSTSMVNVGYAYEGSEENDGEGNKVLLKM